MSKQSREELLKLLDTLKNEKTTYEIKISAWKRSRTITDSDSKKFELNHEINDCQKQLDDCQIKINQTETDIKNSDEENENKDIQPETPGIKPFPEGKPYTFIGDYCAEVDENTIVVQYRSRNIFDISNFILGSVDLKIQINDEPAMSKRTHMGKHGFSYRFNCKTLKKIRIAHITVDMGFWAVNYFLKVDNKDYKFYRTIYKL
jgi:hypothetical protein